VHFDTGSSRQFFVFGVLLFALAAFAVNRLRQGSTGLFSSALRESEAGAVAVGISPVRVRTTLFVLAGALAGLGGALYGSVQNVISPNEFLVQYSIVWLVAVCAIGAGSIWGALVAGVVLGFATTAPTPASPWTSWGTWLQLGLAAAALSFAWHPQGLLELARQRSAKAIQHLAEARRQLEPKP